MKMKRKRMIVFALVLSLIFFFGLIGNMIIMHNSAKLTEMNTTEFEATVRSIEIYGEGTREYCIIHSEEYGDKLITYSIRGISDISDFDRFKSGQTVFFRVENIWLNQFEELTVFPIVSIRTENEEIVSLSSYCEYRASSLLEPTIAGIVVILIFLMLSIHCVLLLRGINVFRRKKT
jgi:hypothetical protein